MKIPSALGRGGEVATAADDGGKHGVCVGANRGRWGGGGLGNLSGFCVWEIRHFSLALSLSPPRPPPSPFSCRRCFANSHVSIIVTR
jgi:hypothetical protein